MSEENKDNTQQFIELVLNLQEAQSKIYKNIETLSERIDTLNDEFVEYKNAMTSKNPTELAYKVIIAMDDIPLDDRFDIIKNIEAKRVKKENEND